MKTFSEQEAQEFAKEFAQTLKGGEVVFLEGDLGSGKTTFVRSVIQGLGFEEPVRSPTFTIVNRYPVSVNGMRQIFHLDLYRVEDPEELRALALEEELGQPDTVTFVEWPELLAGQGVQPNQTIQFRVTETGEHQIAVQ